MSKLLADLCTQPIGKFICSYLKKNNDPVRAGLSLDVIRRKHYESLDEFFSDIKNYLLLLSKDFGEDSDFSLAAQTFLQYAQEEIKKRDQPPEVILKRVKDTCAELSDIKLEEPKASYDFLTPNPIKLEPRQSPQFTPEELIKIHSKLINVNDERKIKDIIKLLRSYERDLSISKGKLTFNLVNISPYTLSFLQAYLSRE